jgi:Gametolysin peptidase M11
MKAFGIFMLVFLTLSVTHAQSNTGIGTVYTKVSDTGVAYVFHSQDSVLQLDADRNPSLQGLIHPQKAMVRNDTITLLPSLPSTSFSKGQPSIYKEEFSALIILTDICDSSIASEFAQSQRSNQNIMSYTLEYFTNTLPALEQCSNGNINFTSSNIKVVSSQIPCNLSYNGKSYDLANITPSRIISVTDILMEYTLSVLGAIGIDTNTYNHKVQVLPHYESMGWDGMAYIGCSPTLEDFSKCYVWINGPDNYRTIFHELGHNYGLNHAGTYADEYGDGTCAMGNKMKTPCFNSLHSSMLGWNSPYAKFNRSSWPLNASVQYTLATPTWTFANHIVYDDSIYIDYKSDYGVVGSTLTPSVNVYTPNGTYTVLLGSITKRGDYIDSPKLKFVVQLASSNETHAMIIVCSYENVVGDCLESEDFNITVFTPTLSPNAPTAATNLGVLKRCFSRYVLAIAIILAFVMIT